MTAYERCPECGEDARACAHQAESGGGRESEDPLHIRPYVRLREAEAEAEAEARAEAGAERAEDAGPAGPAAVTTAVPVPGPEAPMPDLSPFARQGTDETAELPTVSAGSGPPRKRGAAKGGAAAGSPAPGGAAQAGTPPSHRRDRRRPTTAVLAGVGVAAVLGAGLLTTQILTGGDQGGGDGEDRAMRHAPTGAPTHGEPTPSPTREKSGEKESASPTALPARTSASGTPRADRDGDDHAERAAPSKGASAPASRPGSSAGAEKRPGGDRPRPSRPERPSGPTLRPGDSGAAVAELQRRLQQAGFLSDEGEEDGVYSSRVQEGVFRYQARYGLLGEGKDAPGEYGPVTRRHLEARTSG